jgi:hypothetical protein
MTPAQVAAGTLRARTIELGVAANRVQEAAREYWRSQPGFTREEDLRATGTALHEITARLHEITRALAKEETP